MAPFLWDGTGRDRHRFMISHHNRSSAGRRSSFGWAESNGGVRAPSFAYAASESSRTPPPRSGKSYKSIEMRLAVRQNASCVQELEPMIAKAGSCRIGMAGNLMTGNLGGWL
jgi:hypothetical protein